MCPAQLPSGRAHGRPRVIGASPGGAGRQRWQLRAAIPAEHTLQETAAALCPAGWAKCSVRPDEEVKTIRAVRSHRDRCRVALGCRGSLTRVSLLGVQGLLRAPCGAGISVPSIRIPTSSSVQLLHFRAERSLIVVLMWQNLQRLSFARNQERSLAFGQFLETPVLCLHSLKL